jgi:hypothetical protein
MKHSPRSDAPAYARTAIALLVAAILLIFYARFNAISGVVEPYLQRAADPSLYRHDDFINKAVIPHSSLFFDLIDTLRVDLTHPAFILSCYALVSIAAGVAVDRIVRKIFAVDDLGLRIAILFAAAFADSKLIYLNKSSWILEHNFSLSFIACALRIWFLYFALSRNFLAMAAMMIPINLIAIKVGWPLVLLGVILLVQARDRSPATWALLLLSLVVPALAALDSGVAMSPGERAAIFDIFRLSHPEEDNPFAGPLLQIPFYLGGTWFAWIYARRFEAGTAMAIRIILAGSMLIYLLGGLYIDVLSAWFPVPMGVLLSPARGLELAGLLIHLLVLLWIVRTPHLAGAERAIAMIAAITLKMTPDYKWVVLASALALLTLAVMLVRRAIERRGYRWPFRARWMDLPLGLALLAPLIGIFFAFNLSGQRTLYRYDPILGFHNAATPRDAVPMLHALARQQDRRIIFVWQANGITKAPWSVAVRKSGIAGDPYYLARLSDIRRQIAGNALEERLLAELRRGRVDPETAAALAARRVTLVLPSDLAPAVSGWRVVQVLGPWQEMAPPPPPGKSAASGPRAMATSG